MATSSELALAVLVFCLAAGIDVAWTFYMHWASQGKAHASAAASMAMFLLGSASVLAYTTDLRMLIPAAAGNYLGTWLGVTLSREDDDGDE
jgi:hypothetical protein